MPVDTSTLKKFARRLGLYAAIDSDGFIAIARKPGLARRLLILDGSMREHVVALGRLLGYPPCCCRAAKRVGESNLDAWGSRPRRYIGQYHLIDHAGYERGEAIISHIPCSAACGLSLKLALDALAAKTAYPRWRQSMRSKKVARLSCTPSS